MVSGGGLVGGATGREDEVAVEPVEVGVEDELARLCGDGQTRRDRALRLGELAGGSLGFGHKGKDSGSARLVSRLGGERHGVQDFREGGGIAGRDAGRGVPHATDAEPQGKALRLAQRDHLRRALALRGTVATERVNDRLVAERVR